MGTQHCAKITLSMLVMLDMLAYSIASRRRQHLFTSSFQVGFLRIACLRVLDSEWLMSEETLLMTLTRPRPESSSGKLWSFINSFCETLSPWFDFIYFYYFVTENSSLEPLLEGLLSQIHIDSISRFSAGPESNLGPADNCFSL